MVPSADQVVETLGAASDENRMEPLRQEQVVFLPAQGELWMTGDIHDHRRNFDKLVKAADLGNNPVAPPNPPPMAPSGDEWVERWGAASEETRRGPLRWDQSFSLPPRGELWMTGDTHDPRRNFDKLVKAADLGNNPQRHLVLH